MKWVTEGGRWWVVVAAALGLAVSNGPLLQYSFSAFLKPLGEEFAVDRGTLSTAVLAAYLGTALCTLFVGRLVDRFGVRPVLLWSIALFASSIASLSLAPSYLVFILMYGVAGLFSAGTSPLPYSKSVVGNFDSHRGLALGLAMSGVGLGTAVVPQLAQFMIAHYGWRISYVGLGAVIVVVSFPAVLFWLREPRGATSDRVKNTAVFPGLTGRQASATRELWLMAYSFFVLVAAGAGVFAHLVPMLSDRGISAGTAVGVLGSVGIALVIGRLAAGYLLDRIFAPYVTLVFFLVPLGGLCLLFLPLTPGLAVAAIVCLGLGIGAEIDLMGYLISRYFGMRSFGEIYGYMFALFSVGAGTGPFAMGMSYSKSGSYNDALTFFVVSLLIASILILMLGPYRFPAIASSK